MGKKMKHRKVIYAVMLAAIYVAATLLSSLSVLTCSHPHHDHTTEYHQHCFCGEAHVDGVLHIETIGGDCCDHSHALLGEHYTQIIVEKQRGEDAIPLLYALDIPAIIIAESDAINEIIPITEELYRGDEHMPLQAAFSRCNSLRAPPSLA